MAEEHPYYYRVIDNDTGAVNDVYSPYSVSDMVGVQQSVDMGINSILANAQQYGLTAEQTNEQLAPMMDFLQQVLKPFGDTDFNNVVIRSNSSDYNIAPVIGALNETYDQLQGPNGYGNIPLNGNPLPYDIPIVDPTSPTSVQDAARTGTLQDLGVNTDLPQTTFGTDTAPIPGGPEMQEHNRRILEQIELPAPGTPHPNADEPLIDSMLQRNNFSANFSLDVQESSNVELQTLLDARDTGSRSLV